jgi:hypothetical protein
MAEGDVRKLISSATLYYSLLAIQVSLDLSKPRVRFDERQPCPCGNVQIGQTLANPFLPKQLDNNLYDRYAGAPSYCDSLWREVRWGQQLPLTTHSQYAEHELILSFAMY